MCSESNAAKSVLILHGDHDSPDDQVRKIPNRNVNFKNHSYENYSNRLLIYTEVLISGFQKKNGQTTWFDPHAKKLEPHCITNNTT